MSTKREGDPAGASGTSGGTDVEPLRGGMREQERGEVGPEPELRAEDSGHAPRERAGRGDAHRQHGRVSKEGAPPSPGSRRAGDTRRDPEDKIVEERGDHQNEAGNAPSYGAPPPDGER